MKPILLFVLLAFYIAGCQNSSSNTTNAVSRNLAGTKWGFNKFIDEWCDVYSFYNDSILTSYSCEENELINGRYYFQHDTLVIEEFAGYPEGYMPDPNTCELPERIKFTLFISGDSMHFINKYNWVDNKYELTDDTYFRDHIVYQQIQ